MRVLVIGSGGRLGAALARAYSQTGGIECVGLARGEIDLLEPGGVEDVLSGHKFDVLINCAALTNVDYCESHEDEARRVNEESPGRMAAFCARAGARMIHTSTDYVFDGKKRVPYEESDPVLPISVYGASKAGGEAAVVAASRDHLVVRTSWVFGPDRPSFIDMIIRRAIDSERVDAVGDKFSCPTYTLDFAGWLEPLLDRRDAGGILHLCNSGSTTWRELGEKALQAAQAAGVPVRTTRVEGIAIGSLTSFVAARPIYTCMATGRFTALTGGRPRDWPEAVEDYVRDHVAPSCVKPA